MELTAARWYQVNGPGSVATFPGIDDLDPKSLLQQRVTIDGKEYIVLGVETQAVSNTTGKPFGLLIAER
jgi:hypothetical protein